MKYNYTKNLSLLSILTFVVTVAISFKCSTAEKSKDDLTEYKLKGKVKFFKEFSYEAINSFGNLKKGKRVRENLYENDLYVVFNEKGGQMENRKYKSDGSLESMWVYKYTDKINQREGNEYDSKGGLKFKLITKYDDKKNQIEESYYEPSGRLSVKRTYKYDLNGNRIVENGFETDGSLYYKNTYKYDVEGNQIEENWYESDGSLNTKLNYKYDDKGNQIERVGYDSNGSLYYKYTARRKNMQRNKRTGFINLGEKNSQVKPEKRYYGIEGIIINIDNYAFNTIISFLRFYLAIFFA